MDPEDPLFATIRGTRLSKRRAQYAFKECQEKARFDRFFGFHSLRHTFATVAVEAGIPEEVVGRLLNHASKTITGQRYVRPNLHFMRSAMPLARTRAARGRVRMINEVWG